LALLIVTKGDTRRVWLSRITSTGHITRGMNRYLALAVQAFSKISTGIGGRVILEMIRRVHFSKSLLSSASLLTLKAR
jgi:hypothetical protein